MVPQLTGLARTLKCKTRGGSVTSWGQQLEGGSGDFPCSMVPCVHLSSMESVGREQEVRTEKKQVRALSCEVRGILSARLASLRREHFLEASHCQ